jgi:hypothetical protein
VQALGRDFFDKLVAQYHQPSDGLDGPMPTSDNPLRLDNGDYNIPADVVQLLGADRRAGRTAPPPGRRSHARPPV